MAMAEPETTVNGSANPPTSDNSQEPTIPTGSVPQSVPSTSSPAEETDRASAKTPDPESSAPELKPTPTSSAAAAAKWPGWPGDLVFRLIVPMLKVGSIIGRKGELIKKLCDDTRARVRVLDGPLGNPDRVVLISGKEEPEVDLSPAMDAVIRIFKRVSGLPEGDLSTFGAAGTAFCSIRLLVASSQAINLIGKQGSLIKSIQENTGASIRVLSEDETPFYVAADERIVDIHGEAAKVLKALVAIVSHLRKFLVDHSVLPLFEKNYKEMISQDRQVETWADKSILQYKEMISQDHPVESWAEKSSARTIMSGIDTDYSLPSKREPMLLEREIQMGSNSQIPSSRISLYGQDPTISSISSPVFARTGGPIISQITQTMQVPIAYAEEIIGIGGNNIAFIRRTSGAIITVQEGILPNEIRVEIKGTTSQVQMAQQVIQEFLSNHKPVSSSYGKYEGTLRSVYSQLDGTSYPSSSLPEQPYGGYGSSGIGGYSTYRL